MAEAVRFCWLRGEAALPLSAIPDGDRNPLRVRRSVVQAHAPEVVKQLETGRFVAAAWPSDSSIFLILCHPNLAKGSFDAPLIDTRALPQVVLQLLEWDDVTQVARLFLAAHGSEVTNAEECVTARRQLIQWLEGHDQAGMAGTVQHYFAFPLGFRSDAVEVINTWQHVLVQGQKEQLDRFLDEAGRRFEGLGWSRDAKLEHPLNRTLHPINRFYCWVSGQGTIPRAMLCLNRATERRVRGGTYDLLDRQGTLVDLATEIQRVLGEVIEPAAAAVGAGISYPRLGPISRIGPRTTAALTALAEAGDGQWPLPEHAEALWRKFVFMAYREEVALKPEELSAWFLGSGWSEGAAAELTKKFYSDVALLDEYEEAGRQPA